MLCVSLSCDVLTCTCWQDSKACVHSYTLYMCAVTISGFLRCVAGLSTQYNTEDDGVDGSSSRMNVASDLSSVTLTTCQYHSTQAMCKS